MPALAHAYTHPMALFGLFRRIHSRSLRVAIGVLLVGTVIVVDLLFSAHKALSIGIFLGAFALILAVRLGFAAHARHHH